MKISRISLNIINSNRRQPAPWQRSPWQRQSPWQRWQWWWQ